MSAQDSRDWTRPSIILWGVRINDSKDRHDFLCQHHGLAHKLDAYASNRGHPHFQESEFFSKTCLPMKRFSASMNRPIIQLLNTEFVGQPTPAKHPTGGMRLTEHTCVMPASTTSLPRIHVCWRHRWCASITTLTAIRFRRPHLLINVGSLTFSAEPKPAAGFYKCSCDPAKKFLEPAFSLRGGDPSVDSRQAVVDAGMTQLLFGQALHCRCLVG